MLPPLTLANNNAKLFSQRHVHDGIPSRGKSTTKQDYTIIRPSFRASIHVPKLRAGQEKEDEQNNCLGLTKISMIPRDFFVVETNAVVLPPEYPPCRYKSTLNKEGHWDTVVFPALKPQIRQQVLYLRRTLDRMRDNIPKFHGGNITGGYVVDKTILAERICLIIEYTRQETRIYSICFHELGRQIKCICKEQSGLMNKIRDGYDAVVARLLNQLTIWNKQNNQRQDQLDELVEQCDRLQQEKEQLAQRIKELVDREMPGPSHKGVWLHKTYLTSHNEVYIQKRRSDMDDDKEERRLQRVSAPVSRQSIISKHKNITREKHLAARLVQGAYKNYKARKELSRATIYIKKQAAATIFQNLYRAFHDRRLAPHRRAVMETVMRQRKEKAAVDLLQATIRTYLFNRRRNDKSKIMSVRVVKGTCDRKQASVGPPALHTLVPITDIVTPTTTVNNDDASNASEFTQAAKNDSKENLGQRLMQLLSKFRESASVIIGFIQGNTQSSLEAESTEIAEAKHDDSNIPTSTAMLAIFDDKRLRILQRATKEAKAILDSLDMVVGLVPEVSDKHRVSMNGDNDTVYCDGVTLTDSLHDQAHKKCRVASLTNDDFFAGQSSVKDRANNILFGTQDAMRLQKYEEAQFNDTLWHSATNYSASNNGLVETKSCMTLALASDDHTKRLVSLKQFISDMYGTIVTKLIELSPFRLAELLASHCHLAFSFSEWRHQRSQLISNALATGQSQIFNIKLVTRDHFRRQLGLPQLVDVALVNLFESIKLFAAMDPDVRRFQDFLVNKRSEEELVFCCLCRYLCARRLPSDECPVGSATSTTHRQPMFHQVTMREIIDVPHALELAKILFRVNDMRFILESDTSFTEVENVVYRQYLPTNGWQLFEAIVSSFCEDPDGQFVAVSTNEASEVEQVYSERLAPSCRLPSSSPRCARSMVQSTNCSRFQNLQAPRSPITRHQQIRTTIRRSTLSTGVKWVYFEEVLALLITYRREMNQFHLISYWIHELFRLAASNSLLNESAFVETLLPFSFGLSEQELTNIFHKTLRQREQQVMTLRVFTSVTFLLLRNGLLSISTYALNRRQSLDPRHSIQEENENKEWRVLALQLQTVEPSFDAAIKALYDDPSTSLYSQVGDTHSLTFVTKSQAAHALQLLQLRQEIYDLFVSRSGKGRDLERAKEIYEILVNERLARLGDIDT